MRQFLTQAAIFACIQLAIFAVIYSRLPPQDEAYGAVVVDKHHRAQTTTGNRLLLVGGSNLAFGIDSASIQKSTGLQPVNLAISAELGTEFVLNEAKEFAHSGDVILVSLEYEQFAEDTTNYNAIYTIQTAPSTSQYFGWHQKKLILDQGFVYFNKILHLAKHPENAHKATKMRRVHFNEYGDVIGHHNLKRRYEAAVQRGPFQVDEDHLKFVAQRLREFSADCESRDIQVFFLPPVIADDAYAGFAAGDLEKILTVIKNDIDMPLLHPCADSVMPADLFFDTHYHLLFPGKQQRTQLVINKLSSQTQIAGHKKSNPAL